MSRPPHPGQDQSRDIRQRLDRNGPLLWRFQRLRLGASGSPAIALLKDFFVSLYLHTRLGWTALNKFSQGDRWRSASVKINIITEKHVSGHRCIDCRYWSELSHRTQDKGQFEAICLARRSPNYLIWRTEADGCPAWAEGDQGAIDSPDLPPGFYNLR